MQKTVHRVRVYLGGIGLGGIFALLALLSLPSENYTGSLLGYSRNRLLITAGILAIEIGLALLIILLPRKAAEWEKYFVRALIALQTTPWFELALLGSLSALALGADYLYTLIFVWDQTAFPLLTRSAPLVGWATWFAGINSILLIKIRPSKQKPVHMEVRGKFGFPLLTAWGVLAGLIVLIQSTGLGLVPDIVGWDYPGAPLLFSQIILALALGSGAFWLMRRCTGNCDRLIFILLWLAALGIWAAEPMQPSHYALEPAAPSFMYTPYSDAALLMMNAEDMLIGEDFQFAVEKPLYNVLLGLLTAIGRHDYNTIILLQVGILAFFPAVFYLFSVSMDQRFAGLVVAIALILREQNALALAGRINVSHSKLMMTDFPAALGMVVFLLFFTKWMKTTKNFKISREDAKTQRFFFFLLRAFAPLRETNLTSLYNPAFVAGGALGALILIRSQAIILIPVIFLIVVLQFWQEWRRVVLPLIYFLLGAISFILPWMIRNGVVVGKFGYSQPMQAVYLDSQYTREPGVFDLAQVAPDERIEQGFGNAAAFARENPGYVTQFISNHFLHNEVSALLTLPMRLDLADYALTRIGVLPAPEVSPRRAYVDSLPFWSFQERWQGEWPPGVEIALILNLGLLGIGIADAWRQHRWVGLMPLGVHLAYNFSTAIARVSGSRFMLPVDWIIFWYYAIGLAVLARTLLGIKENPIEQSPTLGRGRASLLERPLTILSSIVLLGTLIPILEFLPPTRYTERTPEVIAAVLPIDPAEICNLDEDFIIIQGRALYPRFYGVDEGYGWGVWAAYNHYPFARVGFLVAGPENMNVILPLDEAPAAFPHAEDVFVIGTQAEGYLLAQAVVVQNQEGSQQTILSNQVHWCGD